MKEVMGKPFPEITDMTRPFWEGAAAGRLMMQCCGQCGTVNFHPKPWCIECGSRDLTWRQMKNQGTVYSYTVSHSVAMNLPGWQGELPVFMALVDVDEGARMYAQVTGVSEDTMTVGMRVEAWFEPIGEGAGIPKFRPLSA